jgi:hypothetical protein
MKPSIWPPQTQPHTWCWFLHKWERVGDYRLCLRCGRQQVKVGEYQLDMDLGIIPQFEDLPYKPV